MKVVFTYGRFSPVHNGHHHLFKKMRGLASTMSCPMFIFPSPSHDNKDNPLTFEQKIQFLRIGCPEFKNEISTIKSLNNPFKAASWLRSKGFDDLTMVVGSDRVKSFQESFKGYFPEGVKFQVVSGGNRNKYYLDGMDDILSSSNLRELAKEGVIESFGIFQKALPPSLQRYAGRVYNSIRKGLGLKPINTIEENSLLPFNRFR